MSAAVEELREQLAQQQQALREAKREVGVAVLDGARPSSATRRVRELRDQIDATESALAESERRDDDERDAQQKASASAAREASYRWIAGFYRKTLAIIEAREALAALEDDLLAHRDAPGGWKARRDTDGLRSSPTESDLDADVLGLVDGFPRAPKRHRGEMLDLGRRVTAAEQLRNMAELAERRAEEETRGEGIDFTGTPEAGVRERWEARRAARAEARRERGAVR